jgi:PIN domain nuclease of toxin-antitoxin system
MMGKLVRQKTLMKWANKKLPNCLAWSSAHEIIARYALLLWAAAQPEQLSNQAKALIEDPQNQLYFSAASLWEVSIKNKLGRADFKVDLAVLRRNLLDNGFEEIAINSAHTIGVDALPTIHKDPFDRMLIAQAAVEGVR